MRQITVVKDDKAQLRYKISRLKDKRIDYDWTESQIEDLLEYRKRYLANPVFYSGWTSVIIKESPGHDNQWHYKSLHVDNVRLLNKVLRLLYNKSYNIAKHNAKIDAKIKKLEGKINNERHHTN